MPTELTVLVVDDDFHVARLHCRIVDELDGFRALAPVGSAAEAARSVTAERPDLVLLDGYLPDRNGLDLLVDLPVDTIVVSAASDGASIRRALRSGALGYLVKPFAPQLLQDRLAAYARFRNVLGEAVNADQETIERALRILHSGDTAAPTRSPSATETAVLEAVSAVDGERSAAEVAELVGVSRATAQRYLSALAGRGLLTTQLRYGTTGRPEHRYALAERSR
ncbi:response regulator [Plantibacter sp. VKM Ac-2880]|uniref:response regulator n=1 Tax=Plantibacter sp. VKM Ac-2880 TaxID=2783827 RepID=UPI0018906F1D|nr:response regulator [Plantibacter sp. VKM Ac-2880]MBF4568528.1 response regulator [Plantibacter sp. VKM Ac-2880]